MKKENGFMLLELLITLAMSSFLLLLIGKFFLSAQCLITKVNARTTMQYHGILAMSILRQEMRQENFLRPVQIFEKNSLGLKKEVLHAMKKNTQAIKIGKGSFAMGDYEDHYFYVGQASYLNQRKQKIESLFEKINDEPAQELIPGVSDFQAKWIPQKNSQEKSVLKVSLLINSIDAVGVKRKPYLYQNIWHEAMDEKFYQEWDGVYIVS